MTIEEIKKEHDKFVEENGKKWGTWREHLVLDGLVSLREYVPIEEKLLAIKEIENHCMQEVHGLKRINGIAKDVALAIVVIELYTDIEFPTDAEGFAVYDDIMQYHLIDWDLVMYSYDNADMDTFIDMANIYLRDVEEENDVGVVLQNMFNRVNEWIGHGREGINLVLDYFEEHKDEIDALFRVINNSNDVVSDVNRGN